MRYHLGALSDLEQGQQRIVCRGSAPSQRHHNCKLPPTSPAHAIPSPPSRLLRAVQGREKQHFPTNPWPHPSPGRDRADSGAALTTLAGLAVSSHLLPHGGSGDVAQPCNPMGWGSRGCTCRAHSWDSCCCCPLGSVPLCVTRAVGLRDGITILPWNQQNILMV